MTDTIYRVGIYLRPQQNYNILHVIFIFSIFIDEKAFVLYTLNKDRKSGRRNMESSTKRVYKYFDVLRLLSCFMVLFYHLQLIPSGYLAVATFFTLSGYLSCLSLLRKEKVSLKSYYSHLFMRIYLPFVVIVFITLSVLSFFPDVSWLTLKPETTSVLLGYNNFWQLGANLDYFARHVDSPFMHFWYISILLQFDLVFPFIYLIFKKIGEKVHKIFPILFSFLLGVASFLFFVFTNKNQLMFSYYHTFTRVFSLFFGVSLAFVHFYYPKKISNKVSYPFLFLSFTFLTILFVIPLKSMPLAFLITTILTGIFMNFAIQIKEKPNILDNIIHFLSKASYEIYLVQYPIIFLFQFLEIPSLEKTFLILLFVFASSIFFHFAFNHHQKKASKVVQICFLLVILLFTGHGIYRYYIEKDHTEEMKQLEEQMNQNEQMLLEKQEEYRRKKEEEEKNWEETLISFENYEQELKNYVSNLPLIGVGDSIMLGAVEGLYKQFPNGYFDAAISRTAWVAEDVIKDLKAKNIFSGPVLFNLGSNGDCSEECKISLIESCKGQDIYWVNVVNDKSVHVNHSIEQLALRYPQIHIIDWMTASKDHPEYFVADGIHLTNIGVKAYVQTIYDAIYQKYLEEYQTKNEAILKQHEEEEKKKITFYGNDLLLNVLDIIGEDFPTAQFEFIENASSSEVLEKIKEEKENKTLTHNLVFAFDSSFSYTISDFSDFIASSPENHFYIVLLNSQMEKAFSNLSNVTILPFYQDKNFENFWLTDKLHLTEEGNKALKKLFTDFIS